MKSNICGTDGFSFVSVHFFFDRSIQCSLCFFIIFFVVVVLMYISAVHNVPESTWKILRTRLERK